jgi:hypothetical protein
MDKCQECFGIINTSSCCCSLTLEIQNHLQRLGIDPETIYVTKIKYDYGENSSIIIEDCTFQPSDIKDLFNK